MKYLTVGKEKLEISSKDEKRFMSKFTVGNADQCWEWLDHTLDYGYGGFKLKGKTVRANRLSYAIYFHDPADLHVLHNCDNPRCVNPNHLRIGTHEENMEDIGKRDRRNDRRKINPQTVKTIKTLYSMGFTQEQIATQLRIDQSTVSRNLRK